MTDHEKYPDWEELTCNDPECEICNPPCLRFSPLRNWHGNTPPAPMAVKIRRINWPMIAALLFTLTIWTLIIYAAIKVVRSW